MNMVIAYSHMVVWQVSPEQTWCLILCLMNVWSSALYDMSACPFLTLATAVIRISNRFLFVHVYLLKLPSLFAAWLFWTFHNKSHNMKTLVILRHSWSPFLPLVYIEIMNFYGSLRSLLEYFCEKKLLPDYPCKPSQSDTNKIKLIYK